MSTESTESTPPPSVPATPVFSQEDIDKNKVFAVLAYLGILWLVGLLAAKESPFARFHVNQGLILFICGIALYFASIPLMFLGIGFILLPVTQLAWLVFAIIGIINAAKGEAKPLPLIGKLFTLVK